MLSKCWCVASIDAYISLLFDRMIRATYLLCDESDLLKRERVASSVPQQLVEILVQHFKYKTHLPHVFETLIEPNDVGRINTSDHFKHGQLERKKEKLDG